MSQSWKVAYISTISKSAPVSDLEFDLDNVRSRVVTCDEVTIPTSQTIDVKGLTTITGHCKHVHVLMELSPKCVYVFIPGNTSELRPGKSDVNVVIQNRSGKDVKLKPHTEIGTVTAANIAPTTQVSNDFDLHEQECHVCWLGWNLLTYWEKPIRGVVIQRISYKSLICPEWRGGNPSCNEKLET